MNKECPACKGTGYDHSGSIVDHMTPCIECNGSGERMSDDA
ncbi:molecular chaperone DnaJ [Oceanobacillus arenosus]|uniref:Molecular chaperone DnaJ n=1 Tax=Oceanobacillus arenosus TaxID=1229153 RepID=A0A3D8PNR4_9BACI|nr:molecular chaperone DnaJ [Oceanobacillus arenosus]